MEKKENNLKTKNNVMITLKKGYLIAVVFAFAFVNMLYMVGFYLTTTNEIENNKEAHEGFDKEIVLLKYENEENEVLLLELKVNLKEMAKKQGIDWIEINGEIIKHGKDK